MAIFGWAFWAVRFERSKKIMNINWLDRVLNADTRLPDVGQGWTLHPEICDSRMGNHLQFWWGKKEGDVKKATNKWWILFQLLVNYYTVPQCQLLISWKSKVHNVSLDRMPIKALRGCVRRPSGIIFYVFLLENRKIVPILLDNSVVIGHTTFFQISLNYLFNAGKASHFPAIII